MATAGDCKWIEDEDGIWWAECGDQCWTFESSGPNENQMKFCPFCARPLAAVPFIWEDQ